MGAVGASGKERIVIPDRLFNWPLAQPVGGTGSVPVPESPLGEWDVPGPFTFGCVYGQDCTNFRDAACFPFTRFGSGQWRKHHESQNPRLTYASFYLLFGAHVYLLAPSRPWYWPQLSESEKPLEPRVAMWCAWPISNRLHISINTNTLIPSQQTCHYIRTLSRAFRQGKLRHRALKTRHHLLRNKNASSRSNGRAISIDL